MNWAAFLKEYPAVVIVASGLFGIILGAVLTRWNDSRKQRFELQKRAQDRRGLRDQKIKEARDVVDSFDFIIQGLLAHVEQLVRAIQDGDADQIREEFYRMSEFRLKMKSLLAESKKKLADIALLNDRKVLELFLDLADTARTVTDEAEALPGEYAYGDSAFADTRLKKLQHISNGTLLMAKSIKERLGELALQFE